MPGGRHRQTRRQDTPPVGEVDSLETMKELVDLKSEIGSLEREIGKKLAREIEIINELSALPCITVNTTKQITLLMEMKRNKNFHGFFKVLSSDEDAKDRIRELAKQGGVPEALPK